MLILAVNIELFADEVAICSQQLGDIYALAKDASINIDRNAGLSEAVRTEIEAQSEEAIGDLSEVKTQIAVIEEIAKASKALKKIVEPGEPNWGKFVEVGDEANVVIDPELLRSGRPD